MKRFQRKSGVTLHKGKVFMSTAVQKVGFEWHFSIYFNQKLILDNNDKTDQEHEMKKEDAEHIL